MNKLAFLEGYLTKQSGTVYTPEQKKQAQANLKNPNATAANTATRTTTANKTPFNSTPNAPKPSGNGAVYDWAWGSKAGKKVDRFNDNRIKNSDRTNNTNRANTVQAEALRSK